jgi:outer membrane protein assembly factor BamB
MYLMKARERLGRLSRLVAILSFLFSLSFAAALSSTAAGAEASASTDWPRWRGPGNDGISTETGWTTDWPKEGPKVLWRASVGVGFSSVSVADGRVYTMGNKDGQDIVWCFAADSGKELWTHKYACDPVREHPGPRVTPTVDGDSVYTLSREGHLFCLGAKDGKVRWSKHAANDFGAKQTQYKWGFACSPLILGEKLVLDLGKALALNKKTAELIWSSGDDFAGYSSPTTIQIGGATYINCFTASGLVLVGAEDGKEFARTEWKTEWDVNSASPIPSGDKIFISSGYNRGCALYQVSGNGLKSIYESRKMRNHCNSCVLYKGHIYGLDGQMGSPGSLKCLDFETGEEKWAEKRMKPGGLMLADGKLIAMLDGGELLVAQASPEGYKELARAKVMKGQCWTYPVLSGGRIYCRSNREGELVCVDVRGK